MYFTTEDVKQFDSATPEWRDTKSVPKFPDREKIYEYPNKSDWK